VNPLSPFAYHRRHKRRASLLVILICLATLGVAVMVRLLDSTTEQYQATESYLTRVSHVSARGDSFEAGVVSRIRANPDVARVMPARSLYVDVMPAGLLPSGYPLLGVSERDLARMMDRCDLRLAEGRVLNARSSEVMLSEDLVEALELRLGDTIGRDIDPQAYPGILTPMTLVGILASEPRGRAGPEVLLGFVSYEYLISHEQYADMSPEVLVAARPGREDSVERFLETAIASTRTEVWTQGRVDRSVAEALRYFRLIFGVVDILVAVVLALVVGAINQIAVNQRIQDFGLLNALGHRRGWIVRRLALELAVVAVLGWGSGLVFSWLLFWWVREHIYACDAALNLANLTPIWFTIPIPLVAVAFGTISVVRTFARLDAVAIVDRGQLSTEAGGRREVVTRSSVRPLSPWTYYWRHKRRGVLLTGTIALMILGVAFPAFVFAPMIEGNKLRHEYLRQVTRLSPPYGEALDPGVMAQVRLHPDVTHVVPTIELGLLIDIPPFNRNHAALFGVSQEDLALLLELCGVAVEEGRLHQPRTNEIVVSRGIAVNRSLHVGDKVGRPVYELDHDIPTEMVVVGILSTSPATGAQVTSALGEAIPFLVPAPDDLWLGFASYEYLSNHELYASRSVNLLVVPQEGRRTELDRWLEDTVASDQVLVLTHEKLMQSHRQDVQLLLLLVSLVEGLIAIVAALALAILGYIFIVQRREEFGILAALGHSRRWLVLRTLAESVAVVVVAWLMGAVVCLVGLIYLHAGYFVPKGMSLDFFNPVPWLSTLPLPLTIVLVSAGLVIWMLSRLDPVSIIERR
jgi:ABC-type lipoprotein release transport system permease subunit